MQRKTQAILALYLLSPIVGEMLSGSSPPLEFFSPFGLTLMVLLYGAGALIVRELTVIWGKGWTSTIIMGAAYGIIEEGIMCKSFFDPHWMDVGTLGEYGRILGTNSVWVTLLISFHCVFSITIPILLVNQMYPDQAGKRWISDKGLKQLGSLFAADVLFGFVFMTNYYPGPLELSIFLVLIVLLFYLAYRLPPHPFAVQGRLHRPRSFFFLGAAYSWGLFISGWYMTTVGLSPVVPIALMIAAAVICFYGVLSWSNSGRDWDGRHQIALAAGVLSFLFFLDAIQQLGGVFGMGLVMLVAVTGISLLYLRTSSARKLEMARAAFASHFNP